MAADGAHQVSDFSQLGIERLFIHDRWAQQNDAGPVELAQAHNFQDFSGIGAHPRAGARLAQPALAINILRVVSTHPHDHDMRTVLAQVLLQHARPVVEIRAAEARGAFTDGDEGDILIPGHGIAHLRPHGFHKGIASQQNADRTRRTPLSSALQMHAAGHWQQHGQYKKNGVYQSAHLRLCGMYLMVTSMRALPLCFISSGVRHFSGCFVRKS